MIDTLRNLPAPAKLNLFLHVTGRRPDGYHLLETVFELLDLCDRVHLVRRDDRAIVRRDDVVARFGGDEFLILLCGPDLRSEVARIHPRLRSALTQPVLLAGSSVQVSATVGASVFPDDGEDFAGIELEAHAVEADDPPEGLDEALGLEDGHGRVLSRRHCRGVCDGHLRTFLIHWSMETATMTRMPIARVW